MSQVIGIADDGRPYVQLDMPSQSQFYGRQVIWPGFRAEQVRADLERQCIETDKAFYFLYTPRLVQPERKRKGLMRFAR